MNGMLLVPIKFLPRMSMKVLLAMWLLQCYNEMPNILSVSNSNISHVSMGTAPAADRRENT